MGESTEIHCINAELNYKCYLHSLESLSIPDQLLPGSNVPTIQYTTRYIAIVNKNAKKYDSCFVCFGYPVRNPDKPCSFTGQVEIQAVFLLPVNHISSRRYVRKARAGSSRCKLNRIDGDNSCIGLGGNSVQVRYRTYVRIYVEQ